MPGVDCSPGETCLGLPPVWPGKAEPTAKVSRPWGEAAAEYPAKPHSASERGKSGLILG